VCGTFPPSLIALLGKKKKTPRGGSGEISGKEGGRDRVGKDYKPY